MNTHKLDQPITSKYLLLFALPTIISMLFTGLYSIVDGFFVSNFVSTDALSAVNLMMPIVLFSMAVGMMLGTGGIAVIARKLGEQKHQEAKENFSLLLGLSFLFSILISILAFIFLEPLLYLLGADASLYQLCYDYASIIIFILPFTIFSVLTQNAFIVSGKAHLSLVLAVLGGITNIILDYIFIVHLNMGISGAALATAIGYALPSIVGVLYFIFVRSNLLYLVKPTFDKTAIIESCINGSSEMINSLAIAITTLVFNLTMMSYLGADGVAALTISLYLMSIMTSIYMGYSVGIAPLTSYIYGKKEHLRLHKVVHSSLLIILLISIIVFVLSILLIPTLVGFFTPSTSPVYDIAIKGCMIFSISFLLMGFNLFVSSFFTSLSNGKLSAILSIARSFIFTLATILILPIFLDVTGIWLATPIAELLGLLLSFYYFFKMKKHYQY